MNPQWETTRVSDQSGNAFTAAFASALRRSGFAVAENGQPVPAGAHHVRHLVTPLDNGDLARLTIDDSMEGSRFFVRTKLPSSFTMLTPGMVSQVARS